MSAPLPSHLYTQYPSGPELAREWAMHSPGLEATGEVDDV